MATIIIVLLLVSLSALFSGLTLGVMGLNTHELRRKAALGNERAKRVYPVRKNGNLLLTTLLVGNVAVNTALSIFLGSLAPGLIAGVVATALIVLFGEIIPQAVFSRHGLVLGARVVWLVKFFLFILYPIAKPIAWALDKALGHELPTVYSKKELMRLIEEHKWSEDSDVDDEEEQIIRGALTFSQCQVKRVMTRRDRVWMLEEDRVLDHALLNDIRESAYSRIPVYRGDKTQVVGILFAKQLIGYIAGTKTVGEMMETDAVYVRDTEYLDEVFERFIETRQHLFIVLSKEDDCVGVVAFEDIIEEILREEIIDESDADDLEGVKK